MPIINTATRTILPQNIRLTNLNIPKLNLNKSRTQFYYLQTITKFKSLIEQLNEKKNRSKNSTVKWGISMQTKSYSNYFNFGFFFVLFLYAIRESKDSHDFHV